MHFVISLHNCISFLTIYCFPHYIAYFIGLPYFSGFPSGLKSHGLISHAFLSQLKFVPLPRDRAAMCLRPASKQQKKSVLKADRLVYIAYEVRISCKRPLRATLYVYCYLENQFYVFQTAPVVVYRLMTSVSSMSQHRCY